MSTPYGDFESINTFLATRSYVVGYIPSSADATLVASVKDAPDTDKYPHLARWYRHIASFSDAEKGELIFFERTRVLLKRWKYSDCILMLSDFRGIFFISFILLKYDSR